MINAQYSNGQSGNYQQGASPLSTIIVRRMLRKRSLLNIY